VVESITKREAIKINENENEKEHMTMFKKKYG